MYLKGNSINLFSGFSFDDDSGASPAKIEGVSQYDKATRYQNPGFAIWTCRLLIGAHYWPNVTYMEIIGLEIISLHFPISNPDQNRRAEYVRRAPHQGKAVKQKAEKRLTAKCFYEKLFTKSNLSWYGTVFVTRNNCYKVGS